MQVDVLRDIPEDGISLAKPDRYFTPKSEVDNYDQDEFAESVQYIWAKA